MGVKFELEGNKPTYRLIPEKVRKIDVDLAKASVEIAREHKGGTTDDGNMKLVVEIPKEILYNYLILNGVPTQKHKYWLKDKKNLAKLKRDLPAFCV